MYGRAGHANHAADRIFQSDERLIKPLCFEKSSGFNRVK